MSKRAWADACQTELIRKAWKESGGVCGYRKLHDDILDQGETSCTNRIDRLAKLVGIKAQTGYKRGPDSYGGKPLIAVDNTLAQRYEIVRFLPLQRALPTCDNTSKVVAS